MVDVVTLFIIAFPRNGIHQHNAKRKREIKRLIDIKRLLRMYEPARANEAIHYIIYIARGFSIYLSHRYKCHSKMASETNVIRLKQKSKRPQNIRKICTLLIHDINKGQFVLYRLAIDSVPSALLSRLALYSLSFILYISIAESLLRCAACNTHSI